jgi:arginase
MTVDYVLVGVPTSAGAHHAGQDLAPAAMRAHGFVDKLRAGGLAVTDAGDVAGEVFRADPASAGGARNLASVVRVAHAVADAVEGHARAGRVPIVLGGDCTISVGVVAGLQRVHSDVRLAYFDGDADLAAPGRTTSGILDASGVAHLIGIADTPLSRIGRTFPLLADHQLVLIGYDPDDPDSFDAGVLEHHPGLLHFSDVELRDDPVGVAGQAVRKLAVDGATVAVHFDVDAIDSGDLPLANYPHYGGGVSLAMAGDVLEILLAAPSLGALILTEVNPTYDPAGEQLVRYVETVTAALSSATGSRNQQRRDS